MKKLILTSILATLVAAGTATMAQDWPDEYLGLPGDNLNLYAVMNLFQQSETLEGFERSLNDENSRINNLDLNGDNLIDYIMVHDYVDGDVHTIVLQTALDRKEKQDLAVFTVQRFRDGSVQIQLIGDEALYGRNYIIEPNYDDNYAETPNPGYTGRSGNRNNVTVVRTTYVEIAAWPLVRYIYRPSYVVWRSSWYWGYYPSYWHPWSPYYWHYYYGYHYNWHNHYYSHYRHWHQPRYTRYNDYYYSGFRAYSPNVSVRIKSGNYRTTYSRPESRRDGEALYARTHRDQVSGTRTNTTVTSDSRRSVSTSTGTRNTSGTANSTSRRSSSTVTGRTNTNTSAGQNNSTERRSTTNVNSRTNTNTSAGQNNSTERRSATTVNNRTNTNTSAGQNNSTERRSSPTVNSRTSTSPSAGQSSGPSQRRSPATATNSPGSGRAEGQSAASPRRSSGTVSQSSSSRPATVSRSENERRSGQSSGSVSSSQGRSSSSASSKSTTANKSESSKGSESSNSSRRK